MNDTTLGIIALAAPLLIIGAFVLRRTPWILAFFVVLLAVGIGYLDTTGATRDIGHTVRNTLPAGLVPEHKQAAEEPAPADEGAAMKAETPPPAETPPAETPPAEAPTPAAETAPATPASPSPETNPDAAPAPAPAPTNP